ncbi:MAG: dTDP 4-dehydrorhamnose reductase (DTDP-L-rhamnose synthetase) [Candidatus Uhrbacteria bacterium GW2011_GWE2_41_1153]|nr:MAG: dTDP 4-dehydrorhamnose reductase (DTDP-L-rhamnose synthetase) [Candidatus Uhrbacteria bacterium GW2011_GWE2_41_1153]
MLGQYLVEVFESAGHKVISATRKDLDITDIESVLSFVQDKKPVEEPEIFELAMKINAKGPENLAKAAQIVHARFVHFSTDYVFDGEKGDYYQEDDTPNPISKYGETVVKLFGNQATGESGKEGFIDIMLRLNRDLPDLKIADDEYGLPTYALDAARAVLELMEKDYCPGIYHLVNEGEPVSVYGFAKEVFEAMGITENYRPCPRSDFPRLAKCPHYSPLANTKFPKLRPRTEALAEFLSNHPSFPRRG